MSLRLKLVVMTLFVALVPLTISTLTLLSVHQGAYDDKLGELHRTSARSAAALVETRLENALQTLSQSARSIRWTELTDAEREGALWLVYRQLDEIAVASLLDEQGEGIGASAYLGRAGAADELSGHPLAPLAVLEEFAAHIPFDGAVKHGDAIGSAFVGPGTETPLIPLAVTIPGKTANGRWVVVIGLSLGAVCSEIAEQGTEQTRVMLVDDRDRIVCRSGQDEALAAVDEALANRGAAGEVSDLTFTDSHGEELLATVAPLARNWAVVVQQPVAVAFESSRTIRDQTLLWMLVAVAVAVTTGLLLGRSISRPVERLAQGSEALAKGDFDYRLPRGGRDEIGQLAVSFDRMRGEISKRDAEIRAWNEELQQRVDEQTREIKSIQDQLLQSQKIAAVTSLGAGIAHEINNPLASALAMIQLLLAEAKKSEGQGRQLQMLETAEQEAQRIKRVVGTLMSLSSDYAGEEFTRIDLNQLVDETVGVVGHSLREEKIVVERDFAEDLPPVLGNRTELQQVILQLLKNARIAMSGGGEISLATSCFEDQVVKLAVTDSGKGIEPEHLGKIFDPFFTTKDDWRGEGLGLTMAYRVVDEHHGRIEAESVVGRGTTMTIALPVAARGTHLE